MIRRPRISTRTDTLVPHTTLYRSARSSGRCYNLADHVLVMEKGEQLRCPPSPRYASVKSIAVTEPQTISCPHARCAMDRIGLHADIDPIPLVRDVPAICLHAPDTILALEPGANVEQAVARHSEVGQPAEERTRLCPEGC